MKPAFGGRIICLRRRNQKIAAGGRRELSRRRPSMKKRNQLLRQLLILFLVVLAAAPLIRRVKEGFQGGAEPSWCILLTSCAKRPASSEEENAARIEMHRTVIRAWLDQTKLPIYIVDSSAYPYDEFKDTRLKVISFDLKEKDRESSTRTEATSILHALQNSDIKNHTHILKVTCKYFLEGIETRLAEQSPTCHLYLQYTHSETGQNTELLGFKSSVGEKLFQRIRENNRTIEYYLGSDINKDPDNRYSICRFPPFKNLYTYPRGNGSVLTRL
jgi:hypothetical protein